MGMLSTLPPYQNFIGSEEEDTGSCFPEDSYTLDLSFNPIKMKDLKIGDKIISASPKGEIIEDECIGFLHLKPNDNSNYVLIETENTVLSVTKKHVIIIGQRNSQQGFLESEVEYEFPKNLEVGNKVMVVDQNNQQQLSWERIVNIEQVQKQGMYAPLTNSGNLIVDGILVSCYANFKHQQIADLMFQPYKLLYKFLPSSNLLENNKNTGLLEYADLLMKLSAIMPTELNYQEQE